MHHADARHWSDWLVGTGATRSERALALTAAAIGTALAVVIALAAGVRWQWWQWGVVLILTVDVVGGVVVNALSAAKRLYHRPLRPGASAAARVLHQPIAFAAVHVQPFVLAVVLPDASWGWASAVYLIALLGTTAVALAPLHLARGVGFAAATLGLIALLALPSPTGLVWFGPVLVLKLVVAHAVPEHAYRPGDPRPV